MKKLIAIIIILSFVVSCKITKVKILKPAEEITFLDIMKNFKLLGVSNDGKTLNIENKIYNFEKDMGVFFGLYKKENGTGTDDEYMFVLPAGNEAHTVTVNAEEKKALEEIINIVGEENSGSIIQEILSNGEKLDAESISKSFPDKKDAIQNVINNLYSGNNDKDSFGTYKKYT